jgi:hypothetical protein
MHEDWQRFEGYTAEVLEAFGMIAPPGLGAPPERFLRALYDATAGYEGDPNLVTIFPPGGIAADRRRRKTLSHERALPNALGG